MHSNLIFVYKYLMAYFRLDLKLVCEMSNDTRDFHDYPDWAHGVPMHFHEEECSRCGKVFSI